MRLKYTKVENTAAPWEDLNDVEKLNYLDFHTTSYKEDLAHAEFVVLKFPRWSIISGYYTMHDITKLFLAKRFKVKIGSPQIHAKTIAAIDQFIKNNELKQRILPLLKEAQQTFYNVERLKEKIIPLLLKQSKKQREQSQYYCEDYSEKKSANAQKASVFLEQIVKPYIQIIEGLL